MRPIVKALCVSTGLAFSWSSVSEAQEVAAASPAPLLSTDQVSNILRQLDQLETNITQNRNESLAGALSACRSAMLSDQAAMDLYLKSVQLEEFEKRNLKASDFQLWKERNDARLKDPDFTTALKLQLEYLVMTIQANGSKTHEEKAPHVAALMRFIPKVQEAVQNAYVVNAAGQVEEKNRPKGQGGGGGGGGGRQRGGLIGQLQEPVTNMVIAKVYRLDEYLKNDQWINVVSDVPGMYDKVIIPYYAKEDPERLPSLWDAKIAYLVNQRRSTSSENAFLEFEKQGYPQLLWSKATYLWDKKVQPVQALADMLRILRDNPNHPSAVQWLKTLKDAVASQKKELPQTASAEGS